MKTWKLRNTPTGTRYLLELQDGVFAIIRIRTKKVKVLGRKQRTVYRYLKAKKLEVYEEKPNIDMIKR